MTEMAPQQRDIAMVFQNYALYPHMTVRDNLAYGLKIQRLRKREWLPRVERGGADRSASRACSTASLRRCRAASVSASRWAGRSCGSRRPS